MKAPRLVCSVVFGLLPVLSAHGADLQGEFSVRGVGLVDCATYLKEQKADSKAYYMIGGWLDGYITGVNQYTSDTYNAVSFETTELLVTVIKKHCQTQPGDRLFSVTNSLLKQLSDDRIQKNSPRIDINVDGRKASLYQEVVLRLQTKLAEKGYFNGIANGQFESATMEAIANYQRAEGMEVSGYPDQATLWRLLRRAP